MISKKNSLHTFKKKMTTIAIPGSKVSQFNMHTNKWCKWTCSAVIAYFTIFS